MNEYKQLCNLIDENTYVSFDVYDTALLRNVLHPTDIFELVDTELRKKRLLFKDFKRNRIKSEQIARQKSKTEDVSINDIYKIIQNNTKKFPVSTIDMIKKTELLLEKRFTIVNPFMKSVYEYAHKNNKTIFFISDMYLPTNFINTLLIDNGYSFFQGLFVSGDIGLSKASGRLFYYVRQKLNIQDNWLHIGDNYHSDYQNARQQNINPYYYDKAKNRGAIKNNYSIERSIMKAIQFNYCETRMETNYWEEFGIKYLSILFFHFTLWLMKNLKGKKNAFFLSRDGYLPFLLYKKMYLHQKDLPKPTYILASRRAYQIPNLLNSSIDVAINFLLTYNISFGQKLTLGEVFNNIGLSKETYYNNIKIFGFSGYNDTIDNESNKKRAKRLLYTLYPEIKKNLEKERDLLIQYFKGKKITDQDEINIIDVGWRGSTQKAIQDITGIKTYGFYLGTDYNIYEDLKNKVKGFAFTNGKPYRIRKKIMKNVMLFEFIFSSPHGTLVNFSEKKKKIIANTEKPENHYYYNSIILFQKSIKLIIEKYIPYLEYLDTITIEESLIDYFNFIDSKNYNDLLHFKELDSIVGIGNSISKQYFVTEVTIEDYLQNHNYYEKKANANLWRDSLIINGCLSKVKKKILFIVLKNRLNRLTILLDRIVHRPKNAFYRFKQLISSFFSSGE